QERLVDLPFPFRYYGDYYSRVEAYSNGQISLRGRRTVEVNLFRTLLYFDSQSAWLTKVVGEAPNRTMVIEWRNVLGSYYNDADELDYQYRLSAELLLGEDGSITMQWSEIDGTPTADPQNGDRGAFAVVGIEKWDHSSGLWYTRWEPVLRNEVAVKYWPPAAGTVSGTVTDGPDGTALQNAHVALRGSDGLVLREAYTDAQGGYRLEVPLGTHRLEVRSGRYAPRSEPITAAADNERLTRSFALDTGRLSTDAQSISVVSSAPGPQQRQLQVTNTGSRPLTFEVTEARQPGTAGMTVAQWSSGIPGTVTIGAVGVDHASGNVWVINRFNMSGHEFRADGTSTGRVIPVLAPDVGGEPYDTAYDPVHQELCVHAGGLNIFTGQWFGGISCLDPASGEFSWSLPSGYYPWAESDGFAYRPDTDTFYFASRRFDNPVIYQVAGRSHPSPGALLSSCRLPGTPVIGLAWNSASRERIGAARVGGTFDRIEPTNCSVPGRVPGSGETIELDAQGRMLAMYRRSGTVYTVETGLPMAADQPWLSVSGGSGTLAPGETPTVTVTADPSGLAAGEVRRAQLLVTSDTGRNDGLLQLPVVAAKPHYQLGVNVGGDAVVDGSGASWVADRKLTGSTRYGWTGTSSAIRDRDIDGSLTQDAREGDFGYEFRDLPDGTYEVEMVFADLWRPAQHDRRFDVATDGRILLAGY
ncbi:MAG TPA: carboxypeptidase regulatory-like domain-containing protein, partial [Micromonospora sp.]